MEDAAKAFFEYLKSVGEMNGILITLIIVTGFVLWKVLPPMKQTASNERIEKAKLEVSREKLLNDRLKMLEKPVWQEHLTRAGGEPVVKLLQESVRRNQ